jgi:tetratricopeptide (TPR) repeat protein
MRRLLFLLLLILPNLASSAVTQPPKDRGDYSTRFLEGNKLMEEKLWMEAIKQWKAILESDPNNPNVNYKLGYCLLQTSSGKKEALSYLEVAVAKKVSKNYDAFDPMERKAPVEALYYLGVAQHLNYQLDPAIESFEKVKKSIGKKHRIYGLAERGVEQCQEAKIQMANPKAYVITNLGPVVNGPFNDFSPVLALDESSLFFTSRRMRPDSTNSRIIDPETNEFKEDVYVSFKDLEGQWGSPEILNLNSDDQDATISVSPDGQTLFIYRDSLGDGRILYSKLIGEIWSDPAKLGSDINSPYWETHATISADESVLYFVSDRPGGLGGRDIYRCVKLPNGEWSRALNAGPTINTSYDEDSPFLTPDGKGMYFASQGHNSIGGFDLFFTKLGEDGEWSTPSTMSYPLNSVDDDVFFQPMADGERAFYSSERDGGYGKKDIYLINLPSDDNSSKLAVLKGFIIGEEGKDLPDDLKIVVTNDKSGEVSEYKPRKRDGGYLAILNPCTNYHVDYYQGKEKIKQDKIEVPCESNFLELEREVYLIPVTLGKTTTPKVETPIVEVPKVEEPKKEIPKVEEPKKEEPKATEPKDLGYDPKNPIKTQFIESLGYAEFSRYFVYDSKDFGAKEVKFQQFVDDVEKIIKKNGKITISIEASASRVPSSKFKSNEELCAWRGQTAQDMIANELIARGFKRGTDFVFTDPTNLVQGKQYEKDAVANKTIYEQFQYIKIKVEG